MKNVDRILQNLLNLAPDDRVTYVALRSGWPTWLFVVLLLFGAVLAVAVYFRETSVGRFRRWFLVGLRTLVYALILCLLFSPVVGLQRERVLRRNLLVLVDRSESMAIADKRNEPADIAEAALALGKADFVLPEVQEAVARAEHAAPLLEKLLKQARWEDARQVQREAFRGLEAAMDLARRANKESGGSVAVQAAAAVQAIQEAIDMQRAACNEADKLEQSGIANAEALPPTPRATRRAPAEAGCPAT